MRSIGSQVLPSISLSSAFGAPTWKLVAASSRRRFSIRMDRCISTAAANAECIGGVGFIYAQGYVLEQLTEQTLTQVTGGDKLAFLAGERRVVDHKGHLNGRLGNLNERQSLNVLRVAQGLTDGNAFDAGEANDLACLCLLDRLTAQLLDGVQGNQLRVVRLGVAVVVADGDLLT